VPIVQPVVTAKPRAPQLSRDMALRLVRRAIAKSTRQSPQRLRSICGRADRSTFSCQSRWRGKGGFRWSGRVKVWYRLSGDRLGWFYDLTAKRPGRRKIVTRAARGSVRRVSFAAADSGLICRPL
jgi:hypothetical protein